MFRGVEPALHPEAIGEAPVRQQLDRCPRDGLVADRVDPEPGLATHHRVQRTGDAAADYREAVGACLEIDDAEPLPPGSFGWKPTRHAEDPRLVEPAVPLG